MKFQAEYKHCKGIWRRLVIAGMVFSAFLFGLNACSSGKIDQLNLMPAPDVFDEGVIDPFTDCREGSQRGNRAG